MILRRRTDREHSRAARHEQWGDDEHSDGSSGWSDEGSMCSYKEWSRHPGSPPPSPPPSSTILQDLLPDLPHQLLSTLQTTKSQLLQQNIIACCNILATYRTCLFCVLLLSLHLSKLQLYQEKVNTKQLTMLLLLGDIEGNHQAVTDPGRVQMIVFNIEWSARRKVGNWQQK